MKRKSKKRNFLYLIKLVLYKYSKKQEMIKDLENHYRTHSSMHLMMF